MAEAKKFKGVVTRPFKTSQGYKKELVEGKKVKKPAKEHVVGETFETANEELYKSLIAKKRIK
jgi:hypothetical protein